jgi:hypothetical protein
MGHLNDCITGVMMPLFPRHHCDLTMHRAHHRLATLVSLFLAVLAATPTRARAQTTRYSVEDIAQLLASGVTPRRILQLVDHRCVGAIDEPSARRLAANGASHALVDSLRAMCAAPPTRARPGAVQPQDWVRLRVSPSGCAPDKAALVCRLRIENIGDVAYFRVTQVDAFDENLQPLGTASLTFDLPADADHEIRLTTGSAFLAVARFATPARPRAVTLRVGLFESPGRVGTLTFTDIPIGQ